MTADERRIANAAVGAGPWDSHNQIVTAVTNLLKLEPSTCGIGPAAAQNSDGFSLCQRSERYE